VPVSFGERMRAILFGAYLVGLGVSITLAQTALALLTLWWLWRLAKGRARPGWPLAWPIAAFAAATLVAALLSGRPAESLFLSRNVLLLGSLWVLRDLLPDVRAARRAVLGLLAVAGVVGLVAIAQVSFCAELAEWTPILRRVTTKCHRAHGFHSIYMTFAGVLSVALLATLPDLLRARGRPRWTPVAWLVALTAFALSYVRGAWLGFAGGVMILGGSLRRGRGILFAGLVALAVVLLLLPGVRDRARSIADPNDPTTSERVLMWRSGVAMARDHWLVGVGPGQVKRVYPTYAAPEVTNKHRGHLHNSPLQVLVERGLIGLAAWLWLFAAFFALARGIARRVVSDATASALATGAIASTAGFLLAGLFEHNFGDSEVLMATTFAMALALAVDPES
jgi:putative inorganic carbon (HCO3(-)) transporter